ncbi:MAG TPA: ABC transporter permease [Candidatus Limnocylindria bacterium]|nr:ABC transporter permease [Candidatus Limnocylindria bacterium]
MIKALDLNYLVDQRAHVWSLTLDHIQLSLTALAIALPIAVVLGVLAVRFRFLTFPILALVGILYTIPSLAFLAFLIPSAGIGRKPALIILVVYAQVFLVRNIIAGLKGVNPETLEAARGVGMTGPQVFWKVWLPLALPVIIAGIRIALVTIIGIASITAWINAGGLGDLLFVGINRDYPAMVLAGVVAIVALALVTDIGIRLIERYTPVARALRAGRS